MDLINVFVLFLAFCFGSCVQGNSLETSKNVSAYMGQLATLQCKYQSTQIGTFIFIRWKRIYENGTAVIIAMRSQPMTPDQEVNNLFVKKTDFSQKARTQSNLTSSSISLDLIIDGVECADVGQYECQAMGQTDTNVLKGVAYLDIEVHPGTPAFKSDELQVTVNTSFDLKCEADVGYPAQDIVFSYKGPDMDKFVRITDNVDTEVTLVPGKCTNRAVSTLSITMTEDMDDSRYMCSLPEGHLARDGSPKHFDEIELRVFRETTTVKTTQAPTTTPKEGEVSDSATTVSTSCVSLLCCLVASFMLADRRTDS